MKKIILSATFIILFIGLKAQQARVKKGTTHPQVQNGKIIAKDLDKQNYLNKARSTDKAFKQVDSFLRSRTDTTKKSPTKRTGEKTTKKIKQK